jgi:hypothetical protein
MSPTKAPTNAVTQSPTKAPTKTPTKAPTIAPTKAPTISPTALASNEPSYVPTITVIDLEIVPGGEGYPDFGLCQGGTNTLDYGKSFITPYSDLPFSSSS